MTVHPTTKELRQLADLGQRDLQDADAVDVVKWVGANFGHHALLTQSMANAALAHMVAAVAPEIPVVFLDTGYHFAETLETRDRLVERTGVTLINLTAPMSIEEQDTRFGPELNKRDPDRCCYIRKVRPMDEFLLDYDAWITGMRLAAAPHRRERKIIEYDPRRHLVKVNPLLNWSDEDLLRYTIENDVTVNPLLYDGYPSIGCEPCTRRVEASDDPRSGRWAGSGKLECGLHI
jgi:phosphoadenosine phosphosulfate reductase